MHACNRKMSSKNSVIAKVNVTVLIRKQHNKCFNKIKIKYVLFKQANDIDLVTFIPQKKKHLR